MKKILIIGGISGVFLYYSQYFKSKGNQSNFLLQKCIFMDTNQRQQFQKNAICLLIPYINQEKQQNIQGLISFQQNSQSNLKIVASISGLNKQAQHFISIHEFGDLCQGISSLGTNFNGKKSKEINELCNIQSDENGNGFIAMKSDQYSLFGEYSIVGRSCVVYEKIPQEINQTNIRKWGRIIAFGTIALSHDFKNVMFKQ